MKALWMWSMNQQKEQLVRQIQNYLMHKYITMHKNLVPKEKKKQIRRSICLCQNPPSTVYPLYGSNQQKDPNYPSVSPSVNNAYFTGVMQKLDEAIHIKQRLLTIKVHGQILGAWNLMKKSQFHFVQGVTKMYCSL